ncbi:MAG: hypothetical protein L3J91_00065 [Thermoplasmata archaeon]|nr:hypothetical protein [Thermoplasmata archaeon]
MSRRGSEERRANLGRGLVLLVLAAFAGVLILGLTIAFGFGPLEVKDVQGFLQELDLGGGPPSLQVEALHVAIGLAISVGAYFAVTLAGSRPVRLTGRETKARDQAILALAGILVVALLLIAAKEFFFDPVFEGAPFSYDLVDVSAYAVGLLGGVPIGAALEHVR